MRSAWVGLGRVDHGGARNLVGCSYGQNYAAGDVGGLSMRFTHLSSWRFFKFFPSIANQGRAVKAGLWHGLSVKWSTKSIAPVALSECEKKATNGRYGQILEKVEIIARLST